MAGSSCAAPHCAPATMLVSAIFATALAGHALVSASQARAQSDDVLGGGGSTQNTLMSRDMDSVQTGESIEGTGLMPEDLSDKPELNNENSIAETFEAVEARAPDTLMHRARQAYLNCVLQRHFAPALSAAIVATTAALFYGNATIRNALLDADASMWAAPLPLGAAMLVVNMAVVFNGLGNITTSRQCFGIFRPLYNHNYLISSTFAMTAYLVLLTYLPLADPADASSVSKSIRLTKGAMLLAISAINCHVLAPLLEYGIDKAHRFIQSR